MDVKRNIECRNKTGLQVYGLCEIIGSVDLLMINLSQKDLASILIIWEDNLSKIIAIHQNDTIANESLKKKINFENEATVKKLEVFFIQDENPIREINMKITFDGLQFNLFTDSDEVSTYLYGHLFSFINFIFIYFFIFSIIYYNLY